MTVHKSTGKLVRMLETEPGRFEPTTAFRVAQQAATGTLDVRTHTGVTPAPLPVSHFAQDGETASLRTSFAPLSGVTGSLPPSYDAAVLREDRRRAHGLGTFLDMFSGRMAELFVAACEKYRLARRLRWHGFQAQDNGFIAALTALAGFGSPALRQQNKSVDENTILRFSGFFANRTRNTAALAAMLRDVSGLPVAIESFRSRWLDIPQTEQSKMVPGGGLQLGVNATAGARVHDFASGFRVVIGPLAYDEYLALSPGSRNVTELFALTRLFVGAGLDFDIAIVLRKEDVPLCQLGGQAEPPRLGWNTWARVEPAANDSRDAVLREPPLSSEVFHAA